MTETEIYQEMLDYFQDETGYEMHNAGDLAVRLRAAAAQLMSLYHYGDYVYRQAFPQTAQGESLDMHGALRGIHRIPSRSAEGVLRFGISQPLAADLRIPAGTVCVSGEGVSYETVSDGVLTAGNTFVDIQAQAVEAGSSGNATAGIITRMQTAPDGIETVINPEAFSGGRDEEADKDYRARILKSYEGLPNGANIAFYRELALSVGGIDEVHVVPRINGAGTVGLMVASASSAVTDAALEQLNALLKERRELGIEVVVSVPEDVAVTVKAKILPRDGYTLAQAKQSVKMAMEGCFTGDRMGKTLYLAALSHSAMDTGTIANITISEPEADVMATGTQQVVLADMTLEGM